MKKSVGWFGKRRIAGGLDLSQHLAVCGDDAPVEIGGTLERSLLRCEVHVDQAEALGVAMRPFQLSKSDQAK